MSTPVTFAKVQAYLDAVAANASIDIGNSPHLSFWSVPYATFVTGNVPNVSDHGSPVSIIDPANPLQSPLYVILTDPKGWHGKRQMPGGGPYITDADYSVTLADGTPVTGQQIQADLADWLTKGFPEM